MALLSLSKKNLDRLLRRRRAMGGDRHDEVWNGVYVISPLADNSHQDLVYRLTNAIDQGLGPRSKATILPGCNVSDHPDDWTKNYRCPDVVVFLPGNPAQDRDTHYLGGPDFVVEIISPRDRSRKKFGFYHKVGVRELLLVARRPWSLELYRRAELAFELIGKSSLAQSDVVESKVLDLSFQLLPGTNRPRILVSRPSDLKNWHA